MLYEYAVEPAAISSDRKTCLYLAEKFGFDRGRLLSLFPKRWLPLAIEAASRLPDVEKARVVEKLTKLKRDCSIRSGRNYDAAIGTWSKTQRPNSRVTRFTRSSQLQIRH
jgi:hypothetical protein